MSNYMRVMPTVRGVYSTWASVPRVKIKHECPPAVSVFLRLLSLADCESGANLLFPIVYVPSPALHIVIPPDEALRKPRPFLKLQGRRFSRDMQP